MKLLKEEIRTAIVESAKDEFYRNGYENASMRSIADGTGITVGNIYKYFKNKDELFVSIVGPVYNTLLHIIEHHDDALVDASDHRAIYDQIYEDQVAIVIGLLKEMRIELLILIDGSDGSPFEGIKDKIITILSIGTKEHLVRYYKGTRDETRIDTLAYAFAHSFLEGYFDIVRRNSDQRVIEDCAKEFIKIYFEGFKSVL